MDPSSITPNGETLGNPQTRPKDNEKKQKHPRKAKKASTSPAPSEPLNPQADTPPAPAEALAVRPKDAARMLGICERLLWSWTHEGKIPHLRIGRAVLYPVPVLQKWLDDQAARGVRR